MPQSPRWLLGKNRTDEALEVLLWLRGPEANIKEECSNIKDTLGNNLIHHPSRGSFFIGKEKTTSEVEEKGGGGRGGINSLWHRTKFYKGATCQRTELTSN